MFYTDKFPQVVLPGCATAAALSSSALTTCPIDQSTCNTKSAYGFRPLLPWNSSVGRIGVCGAGNGRYRKRGDAEHRKLCPQARNLLHHLGRAAAGQSFARPGLAPELVQCSFELGRIK